MIVSRLVAPEVIVVAEIVAEFNMLPVAVPEKVRLLIDGDAVKFTVGELDVPPVVMLLPG